MGRNNHNAGMHFVYHSSRVSDKDAVDYIKRIELILKQNAKKQLWENMSEQDSPCKLFRKDMITKVHVNYFSKEDDFVMYHYVINNSKKKKNIITVWVGYDIGGKNSLTGEVEPRGYYFYFKHRYAKESEKRKYLLFEVKRQSNTDLKRAVDLATVFGKEIVSNYYPKFDIDWENPIRRSNGKGDWMYMEVNRRFRTISNCEIEK